MSSPEADSPAARRIPLPAFALFAFLSALGECSELHFFDRPGFLDSRTAFSVGTAGGGSRMEMLWPEAMGALPLYAPGGLPLLIVQGRESRLYESFPAEPSPAFPREMLEVWLRATELRKGPSGPASPWHVLLLLIPASLAAFAGLFLRSFALAAAMLAALLAAAFFIPPPGESLFLRSGAAAARISFSGEASPEGSAWVETPRGKCHFTPCEAGSPPPGSGAPLERAPAWMRRIFAGNEGARVFHSGRGLWERRYYVDISNHATKKSSPDNAVRL